MIRYSLTCQDGHTFETWFRSSGDFDVLAAKHEVLCPVCGSAQVVKAPMAPAVATAEKREARADAIREMVPVANPQAAEAAAKRAELVAMMRRLREEVTQNADYVGDRFAEEARRIHFEEAEPRGIYGEATAGEVSELAEDGITVLPLPRLPEDGN